MANVDWLVMCERVIVEAEANTASLIALVETVTIPTPPPDTVPAGQIIGVPFRFYVVQQWMRTKASIGERVYGRLVLKGPNGKRYDITEFPVDLKVNPKVRVITQLGGFPFAGAGAYKFIVQIKRGSSWRAVREAEFTVNVLAASSALTRH